MDPTTDSVNYPDEETIEGLSFLSYLRSAFIVGAALASKFPTEDEWQEAITDQEFIDAIAYTMEARREIVAEAEESKVETVEELQQILEPHYDRMLGGLEDLAEELDVSVEDLLYIFS